VNTQIARRIIADPTSLIRWLKTAAPGEQKIYHAGMLAADRIETPDLDDLARLVAILSETGFLHASQYRQELPLLTVSVYVATRTGKGYAPSGLISGKLLPLEFEALKAVLQRDADISVTRAVRDALSTNDASANAIIAALKAKGLIQDAPGKGFALSKAAIDLMT
jgi:hypothetical protein